MFSKLIDYFNTRPRLGAMATANAKGRVNVAYFGSARMISDGKIVIGLGDNRTLSNLRENPNAAFILMNPGETVTEWRGLRIYMEMISCESKGDMINDVKDEIASRAGRKATEMIKAAALFKVTEIRPLVDVGQAWETSI